MSLNRLCCFARLRKHAEASLELFWTQERSQEYHGFGKAARNEDFDLPMKSSKSFVACGETLLYASLLKSAPVRLSGQDGEKYESLI